MLPDNVIMIYLQELKGRPSVPHPSTYYPSPPEIIKKAYEQYRIAYDAYITAWISESLGGRLQQPASLKKPKKFNDLPMVKDALPRHIAKEKRDGC